MVRRAGAKDRNSDAKASKAITEFAVVDLELDLSYSVEALRITNIHDS